MKRRSFFSRAAASAAAIAGAGTLSRKDAAAAPSSSPASDCGRLAGRTLEKLRDEHRYWLFDDFLPFMDKYVVDHELGGFMTQVDRDGTRVDSTKTSWYEGRGIWTYSYLYNKLERNPDYLEIARKSKDFILRHEPEGDDLWPLMFTKEGRPTGKKAQDIYGDLFIALGLQEFAKAKGDEQSWDTAKGILLKCLRLYDSPDYRLSSPLPNRPPLKGPRVIGHWMIFLNVAGQMLEMKSDPQVEDIAARCVEAVMNDHFNPDFGLLNEIMSHDLSRDPDYAQYSYTGHACETLWMVMQEGLRKKDDGLFNLAAERFRRHVEVCHDDVYGGWFRSLDHVDENRWTVDKYSWLQEEVLVGTMILVEQAGSAWAQEWYGRAWNYVLEKLALKQYGFPLWANNGDRRWTFVRHARDCEHFHHPRHLMLNIQALDRLIKREGSPGR